MELQYKVLDVEKVKLFIVSKILNAVHDSGYLYSSWESVYESISNDNVKTPSRNSRELTAEEISEQRQIRCWEVARTFVRWAEIHLCRRYNVTAHSEDIKDNYDALEDQEVAIKPVGYERERGKSGILWCARRDKQRAESSVMLLMILELKNIKVFKHYKWYRWSRWP